MIDVKIFSSLIAFVMMFACLSTASADVVLAPRERNVKNDFVTADVDDNGKFTLKFEFPFECDYAYQLIDKAGNEVLGGNGSYKSGDIVEETKYMQSRLTRVKNFFLLKTQMSNIKVRTRFGTKIRDGSESVTKTILIVHSSWNNQYGLYVYDGDRTGK